MQNSLYSITLREIAKTSFIHVTSILKGIKCKLCYRHSLFRYLNIFSTIGDEVYKYLYKVYLAHEKCLSYKQIEVLT